MRSYEEFLDDWIMTDKETQAGMTRAKYYKTYCPNSDPRYLYDFILENYKE